MMAGPAGQYAIPPIGRRLREEARTRGWSAVMGALAGWGLHYAAGLMASAFGGTRATFELGGRRYRYLVHRYNFTWMHERAVEVPVAQAVLVEHAARGGRVLEVGHVLGHYGAIEHEVVDKYERDPRVRNIDVLDLEPARRYDLVVSLSTMEHVGIDDEPRDPARAVAAVERLRSLVADGGTLLVTVPVGYNRPLVEAIREGQGRFDEVRALVRQGSRMRWREVAPEEVWDLPYDRLLYRARAILVCSFSP